MRAHDGGIQHHVFIVVVGSQVLEYALENTTFTLTAHAPVDVLPVAKTLRKIAPRDAGPIAIKDRLDKQTIVPCRTSDMPLASGQKVLDPIPLIVS